MLNFSFQSVDNALQRIFINIPLLHQINDSYIKLIAMGKAIVLKVLTLFFYGFFQLSFGFIHFIAGKVSFNISTVVVQDKIKIDLRSITAVFRQNR
ncbi:hypothetical protein IPC965_06440 [Pseudomonas aeruginosa]|nr:hypothetical protein IPC1223_04035 [Pseudomonas aeruginosa]RPT57410.1 hypothetical protein IPC965_06440 [Pseudomonas aeruginosa]HBP5733221.1 hypothetical protein [Pseudomonas aeruginosa]